MSGDRPMRPIFRRRLFWANRRGFLSPGLKLWAYGRHWTLLPLPATRHSRKWKRSQRA